MSASYREMPEAERRRHQTELGLVIVSRRAEPQTQPEKKKRMDQTHDQTQRGNGTQAHQTLDKISRALNEPPTFKDVATHELKRAAVYVPILFSAGVGLAWTCKRLFLKGV